jgi:predicted dehydrogenase
MEKIKIIVIGAGNMGSSHARAYAAIDEFELTGIVDRDPEKLKKLTSELGEVEGFASLEPALEKLKPEAVAVCTYPDSHFEMGKKALESGAHVFIEKPLAGSVSEAQKLVDLANQRDKKIVVGYILRQHPSWILFVNEARKLGSPLVMRMNLNQQSKGAEWETHKMLMKTMSPIVDCGVHYVDVMCQMTRSKPLMVQAIGTRLTAEIASDMYNYGQLQVTFEDGSVGWYEAGWGPMMSETAFFVKDVIGPEGSVSIVDPQKSMDSDSSDIDSHTKTSSLLVHQTERDNQGEYTFQDKIIDTSDEPDHQELCNREQRFFLKAIKEDLDLKDHLEDAVNSLRIVLAADESIRTGQTVRLK